tara:strand:+ start:62 stop:568 length:507 start_codon:yes stop_codon:yes gene_type:complete
MASILNVDKIRATGSSTDAITVDTSGNVDVSQVLTSRAVGFSVLHTTDGGIAATGSYVKVPYNAATFDSHSAFDFTDDDYTVPVAGVYYFNFTILQLGNWASNISFHKNGTAIGPVYRAITTSEEQSNSGSIVLDLALNDVIDLRIKTTSAGNQYYRTHGGLHGFLIG